MATAIRLNGSGRHDKFIDTFRVHQDKAVEVYFSCLAGRHNKSETLFLTAHD